MANMGQTGIEQGSILNMLDKVQVGGTYYTVETVKELYEGEHQLLGRHRHDTLTISLAEVPR